MGSSLSRCVEPGPSYAVFDAVRRADIDAINRRLSLEPDLLTYKNLTDRDTLWHAAAALGSEEVLDALLRHGREGLSPEALAAAMGSRNGKGQTPLIHAACMDKTESVRWFVRQGADVWAYDRCGNRTALHYAAMRGAVGVVDALLDSLSALEVRRYLEARSISGLTPLHYAAARNQAEAVWRLLTHGADILAVNSVGHAHDLVYVARRSSALHVAAAQASLEAGMALLRYWHEHLAGPSFPDPRRRLDMDGRTPAAVALSRPRSAVLAELLHPGTDLATLFSSEGPGGAAGAQPRGVPRLAVLAGSAVRQQLLADVDKAEGVIAEHRARHAPGAPPPSPALPSKRRPSSCLAPTAEGGSPPPPALPPGWRMPAPCCPPPPQEQALGGAAAAACSAGSQVGSQACCPGPQPPKRQALAPHAPPPPPSEQAAHAPAVLQQQPQQPPPEQQPLPRPPPLLQPACCAVRQRPNRFVCRSAGFLESEFAAGPVAPVVQCVVCLEDAHCLLSEPCHHRLCATCARHVTQRAPAMPLTCPICRVAVHQFTSPVC